MKQIKYVFIEVITSLWTLWKLGKRAGGIKGKWKLVLERVESRFHAPLSLMVAVCSEIMPPWKRHTEVADKAKEVISGGGVLSLADNILSILISKPGIGSDFFCPETLKWS